MPGVLAVTERHVIRGCCDKLVFGSRKILFLLADVAEGIEDGRVLIILIIEMRGKRRCDEDDVLRNIRAIGECQGLEGFTHDRDCRAKSSVLVL